MIDNYVQIYDKDVRIHLCLNLSVLRSSSLYYSFGNKNITNRTNVTGLLQIIVMYFLSFLLFCSF